MPKVNVHPEDNRFEEYLERLAQEQLKNEVAHSHKMTNKTQAEILAGRKCTIR